MKKITKYLKILSVFIVTLCVIGLVTWGLKDEWFYSPETVKINLDQEVKVDGVALNSSTQSINRYHSQLRYLEYITPVLSPDNKHLSLRMSKDKNTKLNDYITFNNINTHFLTPLLPYDHGGALSEFDSYNLMLSEFARNGVSLSRQQDNDLLGTFYDNEFFNADHREYLYESGQVLPNSSVTPKRMSIVNNCLTPGLWEINAVDSVGEMYHGWFSFPKDKYFSMLKANNDLDVADWKLRLAMRYKKDSEVELDLDKLRKFEKTIDQSEAVVVKDKSINSYSTQDSRRKVQRNFYSINRADKKIEAETFADLLEGDIFKLFAFIPPGIYTNEKYQHVSYNSDWKRVEINTVTPKTQYKDGQSKYDDQGYVEIKLFSADEKMALLIGNIPVSLLVLQEDYDIPALGVGVLPASEPIERRYFRLKEGPRPHYAYMAKIKNDKYYGVNNHEYGLEQIFLRPFVKNGKVYLRLNLVSYERIMDILEVEIPLNQTLSEQISLASDHYQRPLFRTYLDSNIL